MIPEGTALRIRLADSLSSQVNEDGDTFEAILDRDVFDERGNLVAATGTASHVLGMETRIGTVETGKTADLVLVKGNPLEEIDIFNTPDAIVRVMKNGIFV